MTDKEYYDMVTGMSLPDDLGELFSDIDGGNLDAVLQ